MIIFKIIHWIGNEIHWIGAVRIRNVTDSEKNPLDGPENPLDISSQSSQNHHTGTVPNFGDFDIDFDIDRELESEFPMIESVPVSKFSSDLVQIGTGNSDGSRFPAIVSRGRDARGVVAVARGRGGVLGAESGRAVSDQRIEGDVPAI